MTFRYRNQVFLATCAIRNFTTLGHTVTSDVYLVDARRVCKIPDTKMTNEKNPGFKLSVDSYFIGEMKYGFRVLCSKQKIERGVQRCWLCFIVSSNH
jgi:hypothetical protein